MADDVSDDGNGDEPPVLPPTPAGRTDVLSLIILMQEELRTNRQEALLAKMEATQDQMQKATNEHSTTSIAVAIHQHNDPADNEDDCTNPKRPTTIKTTPDPAETMPPTPNPTKQTNTKRQQMPSAAPDTTRPRKGKQLSHTSLDRHYRLTAEEVQKSNQINSHCQTCSRS